MLIIMGATDKCAPPGLAPIPIGLALMLIHLISIPVTNTSVNPARVRADIDRGRLGHRTAVDVLAHATAGGSHWCAHLSLAGQRVGGEPRSGEDQACR